MNKARGFTVVETIAAVVLVTLLGAVFYMQRSDNEASHRDTARKTALNAIYYNLVELAKPTLGGYPRVLSAEQLKAMDAALLKDPRGKRIGQQGSDYRYDPTDCSGGDICQGFTLRANLEREDTFVLRSPTNRP